jgi:bifunctional DNA-binding transcriptional regulator/antitoxin component of YhaV-PrlF toxin-antitoxin module
VLARKLQSLLTRLLACFGVCVNRQLARDACFADLGLISNVARLGKQNLATRKLLTCHALPNDYIAVKITRAGQVTIPLPMRRKHGLRSDAEVEFVDQPEGVLVVKVATQSRGKRALATLLRGGKIKGRTKDWLRLTRG